MQKLFQSPIFRSLFPRPQHFSSIPSDILDNYNISNEILALINSANSVDQSLNQVSAYLNRDVVISIIQSLQCSDPILCFRFFIWAAKFPRFRGGFAQNLVVDMLVKDDNIDFCWKVLEEVRQENVPIAPDVFVAMILGYWKLQKAEKAVETFSRIKDYACNPNLAAYNVILNIMVKKDVILLALAVYNMMLKSNCRPDCSTFSTLINGMCKSGNNQDALKLFDEMSDRGIFPNRITYTVILSGLCQARRTDDAYRLLNLMKSKGCTPDLVTYNALLAGFCKLGRVDEALALFEKFRNDGYFLGLKGFSSLIDGLVRAKRIDEAEELFLKVFEVGLAPDIVLYTIMIRGLSGAGRINDALSMLRDMTQRGIVPDTLCYNTLIKGFCDVGLLDEARALHLEISQHDQSPDACTYTVLICGLCRNGLVGEAQDIFNDMDKLGCSPSVVTFNALIDGLFKAGKVEEAQIMFYKMEIGKNQSLLLRLSQGMDRVLDGVSLQKMVEKLCESGAVLKAYKLLMQLFDSGVVPDIVTYNTLISGMCKAGQFNGAFKLFKELQLKGHVPDSVTYSALIDGLQRVDREADAFKLFEQMKKNGFTPSSSVYKTLMTWCCRRGNISLAFSLWLNYLRSLANQELEAIKVVEEYLQKGELERGIRKLLKMELKFREFDSAPYNIWLTGLCQAQRVPEALNMFFVLEEFSVLVSAPSCVMLISGLCVEGKLDEAVKVFLYTMQNGYRLMPRICNNLLNALLCSPDNVTIAIELLDRMKHMGYNLKDYLHHRTKVLLHQNHKREAEKMSTGYD